MQPSIRQVIERRIVERVIHDLLKAGFDLALNTGLGDGSDVVKRGKEVKPLIDAIMKTDEDVIRVWSLEGTKWRERFVHFVYGNDGFDVIHDYTVSLDPIIEPIIDNAELIGMGQALPNDTELKSQPSQISGQEGA